METKNVLVAYFSCSGVTASVAKKLADAADAELFEIEPVEKYTKEDLNWMDKKSRTTLEMNDPVSRPAIKNKCADMAHYDVVFIGFPIWWYVEPKIIDTFLESYDFENKTVIPFATSGGSGFGKAGEQMKRFCSVQTKWKPGKMLNGTQSAQTLGAWIKELGL